VAVDGAGNVFVADTENHTIRQVTPAGLVKTLAGKAGVYGSANGTGSTAMFSYPWGAAADSAGNVSVADNMNSTIRQVTAVGVVTTLAGSPGASGTNDGTRAARRGSTFLTVWRWTTAATCSWRIAPAIRSER
jgi:hypothetical protein